MPTCTQKVLLQCGQGMVAVGDPLARSVLFCYRDPVGLTGFCSFVDSCLNTTHLHPELFAPMYIVVWLMPKAFREAFTVECL